MVIPELQSGFVPTYPTVLFEKNLILDMGDMTIELYSIGGMHTDSDIVIFVPEEGLVAIGDVPPDQLPELRLTTGKLTQQPPCTATAPNATPTSGFLC